MQSSTLLQLDPHRVALVAKISPDLWVRILLLALDIFLAVAALDQRCVIVVARTVHEHPPRLGHAIGARGQPWARLRGVGSQGGVQGQQLLQDTKQRHGDK